jgi:hypothetical protein
LVIQPILVPSVDSVDDRAGRLPPDAASSVDSVMAPSLAAPVEHHMG